MNSYNVRFVMSMKKVLLLSALAATTTGLSACNGSAKGAGTATTTAAAPTAPPAATDVANGATVNPNTSGTITPGSNIANSKLQVIKVGDKDSDLTQLSDQAEKAKIEKERQARQRKEDSALRADVEELKKEIARRNDCDPCGNGNQSGNGRNGSGNVGPGIGNGGSVGPGSGNNGGNSGRIVCDPCGTDRGGYDRGGSRVIPVVEAPCRLVVVNPCVPNNGSGSNSGNGSGVGSGNGSGGNDYGRGNSDNGNGAIVIVPVNQACDPCNAVLVNHRLNDLDARTARMQRELDELKAQQRMHEIEDRANRGQTVSHERENVAAPVVETRDTIINNGVINVTEVQKDCRGFWGRLFGRKNHCESNSQSEQDDERRYQRPRDGDIGNVAPIETRPVPVLPREEEKAACESAEKAVVVLKAELLVAKENLVAAQQEKYNIQLELNRMEARAKSAETRVAELTTENAKLKADLELANKKLEVANQKVEEADARAAEAAKKAAALEAELKALKEAAKKNGPSKGVRGPVAVNANKPASAASKSAVQTNNSTGTATPKSAVAGASSAASSSAKNLAATNISKEILLSGKLFKSGVSKDGKTELTDLKKSCSVVIERATMGDSQVNTLKLLENEIATESARTELRNLSDVLKSASDLSLVNNVKVTSSNQMSVSLNGVTDQNVLQKEICDLRLTMHATDRNSSVLASGCTVGQIKKSDGSKASEQKRTDFAILLKSQIVSQIWVTTQVIPKDLMSSDAADLNNKSVVCVK